MSVFIPPPDPFGPGGPFYQYVLDNYINTLNSLLMSPGIVITNGYLYMSNGAGEIRVIELEGSIGAIPGLNVDLKAKNLLEIKPGNRRDPTSVKFLGRELNKKAK